jgi:GT2 family glycosyltransferase
MKKVSVHIVTYNSEAYIRDCLEAVMAQSYPIDSIIIIDNNSSDGTEHVLQPFLSELTYVKNKQNVGFAAGHNQAIRLSKCDYYLILNPDVKLNPDYVVHLMHYIESDPNIGSATGKLVFKQSPSMIDSTGLKMNKARRAFDRGAGSNSIESNQNGSVFGVSGAAALYTKRMVDDISIDGCFFDEDFFAYKEDVDIAWRSQLMGWTSVYGSMAMAYHDRGWKKGSRSTIPLFIRKYSYINRYKMMIKNDNPTYLMRHFIPLVVYELSSFTYLLIKEPKVLTAWIDLIKVLPDLIHKRKLIQKARKVDLSTIYTYFK